MGKRNLTSSCPFHRVAFRTKASLRPRSRPLKILTTCPTSLWRRSNECPEAAVMRWDLTKCWSKTNVVSFVSAMVKSPRLCQTQLSVAATSICLQQQLCLRPGSAKHDRFIPSATKIISSRQILRPRSSCLLKSSSTARIRQMSSVTATSRARANCHQIKISTKKRES